MEDYLTNVNERGSYQDPLDLIEPPPEDEMRVLADGLGRLLEWTCRSGQPLVVGQRTLVLAYVLRPDLVNVSSSAELARGLGVTRAAVNKTVNDFRDTFGVRTGVMRNEETRDKCRQAQQI